MRYFPDLSESTEEKQNQYDIGIRKLASAIIIRAVVDFYDNGTSENAKHHRRSAAFFLNSDSDRDFGFISCCEILGCDFNRVRKNIKQRKYNLKRGCTSFTR